MLSKVNAGDPYRVDPFGSSISSGWLACGPTLYADRVSPPKTNSHSRVGLSRARQADPEAGSGQSTISLADSLRVRPSRSREQQPLVAR